MKRRVDRMLVALLASTAALTARAVAAEQPPCATPPADADWFVAAPAAVGFAIKAGTRCAS